MQECDSQYNTPGMSECEPGNLQEDCVYCCNNTNGCNRIFEPLPPSTTTHSPGTTTSTAIPTTTTEFPGSGEDPSGSGDDPSGSGDDPSGSGDDPSGSGDDPSGSGDDPSGSGSGDDPSGSGSGEERKSKTQQLLFLHSVIDEDSQNNIVKMSVIYFSQNINSNFHSLLIH